MEFNKKRSLKFKIVIGYLFVLSLVGCIVYIWHNEKQKLISLETVNKDINDIRKQICNIYVQIAELSLKGETVLEWTIEDVKIYQKQRLQVDSMLCHFKNIHEVDCLDSVCYILKHKEKLLYNIVKVLNGQSIIDESMGSYIPITIQNDIQEETKRKKRGGFLGLFSKKKKSPNSSMSIVYTLNRNMVEQKKVQTQQLTKYTDSLATKNVQLNQQLQQLIMQMDRKIQMELQQRELKTTAMREQSFLQISGLTGVVITLLLTLYIIIHRDIKFRERDRQKLEESLRQNDILLEMRKNIILTISHDIRGPLNVIGGSVELAMGAREKKKRDYLLKNVELLCKHILHLLNNLLDVYRLNESKETTNAVPFRLSDFLDRIVAGVAHTVNNKGLLFVHDFKGTDVTVMGDMDRIEQIIDNLLTNAVKFTRVGSIDFSSVYADGRLMMTISDTGIGMTKETLERIFLPFQRTIDDTNADGFGLGLSITKGLVSLLGGTIDVTSDVGKGTTFRISLPLPETAETVEEEVVEKETPLNLPHYVLVIDDDPMQQEVIKEMLERNGVSCMTCTTTVEVVREMRKKDYDMLLTDIQMPGTSGFALLELLRKSNIRNSQTIPVIAMTARGDNEKDSLLGSGFTSCIFKPFSTTELLKCLSSLMDKSTVSGMTDFTPLISEVSDKCKVLEKFIEGSRRDMECLRQAMEKDDRKELWETIHRMWPLWELLQKEAGLGRYRELLKDKDAGCGVIRRHTENLIDEIEKLITQTENEIRMIQNEKDTDSGR
ncbi:hybrid sensor histidine kinase/response regulator [Parabacteroides distasonis]|uniref:hybrid sensor histidine kinase/response regulator n=2 Tax=Parabacteroides distasonis TaxID=823 RepID=UPI00325A78CF